MSINHKSLHHRKHKMDNIYIYSKRTLERDNTTDSFTAYVTCNELNIMNVLTCIDMKTDINGEYR